VCVVCVCVCVVCVVCVCVVCVCVCGVCVGVCVYGVCVWCLWCVVCCVGVFGCGVCVCGVYVVCVFSTCLIFVRFQPNSKITTNYRKSPKYATSRKSVRWYSRCFVLRDWSNDANILILHLFCGSS